MYAQLTCFDGPRSEEMVAAAERAGKERLFPAIAADPVLGRLDITVLVLRRPDGSEVVITLAPDEQALRLGQQVIMGTSLLPGEEPALLPGPDRVEIYQVVHTYETQTLQQVR